MVKKITILVIVLLCNLCVSACDACGCSINGNGFGILSKYKSNLLSMGWQHGAFRSNDFTGNSNDFFNTVELSARINLPKSFRLSMSQGIKYNVRYKSEAKQSLRGLSDGKILLSYPMYQNNFGTKTNLYFEIGGGLKFPNGTYKANIHDEDLPENFNAGTGNWGILFQPVLILKHKNIGLVTQFNYDHYGKSKKSDYEFGNRDMWSTSFFYEQKLTSNSDLIASYGIMHDKTQKDTYASGNAVHGTGNKILHSNFSLLYKNNNVAFGINYFLPMTQDLASGEVLENYRFSTNITYLF